MTVHDMQVKLEALADDLRITEERREALDLERRRLAVSHSLLLHRDSASADDLRAMIAHLEAAGMPGEATLKIDGGHRHTRMYARWSTDPDGYTNPRGEDEDGWPEPDAEPAPEPEQPVWDGKSEPPKGARVQRRDDPAFRGTVMGSVAIVERPRDDTYGIVTVHWDGRNGTENIGMSEIEPAEERQGWER